MLNFLFLNSLESPAWDLFEWISCASSSRSLSSPKFNCPKSITDSRLKSKLFAELLPFSDLINSEISGLRPLTLEPSLFWLKLSAVGSIPRVTMESKVESRSNACLFFFIEFAFCLLVSTLFGLCSSICWSSNSAKQEVLKKTMLIEN